MKAVVCQHGDLDVRELELPALERGQVLLSVSACGICGSDLHARHASDAVADDVALTGYLDFMRADQPVVMGHEFSGEVLDHGPRTSTRLRTGTPVVSLPMVRTGGAVHLTGLSERVAGGYAEQVRVTEALTLAVPNGLPLDVAALTEPMAVALHAVRRGQVGKRQIAYVIGCGPIGLGVIAMLKATGVRHVVASDFSAARRALATQMGADVVVDPAEMSPYEQDKDRFPDTPAVLELAVGTMERLRAVPYLPWWQVFRAADKFGASPQGAVIFECVGVPGMIQQVVAAAPLYSRVVVVGVCMAEDQLRPSVAINKEIDLRFVFAYLPDEFRETLHLLAEGRVDPRPLITGRVGLDEVAQAFDDLADPEVHAKILITP